MEWKTVKLWELCMELSDGLHKAPKFDKNGDYIFVNAQNLVNGHIEDKDPNKRTTYEEFIKYSKPLNEDTILYSIDGTIGNMAKYRGEKVVLGKGACYLTPKIDQLHSDYLYYQLQSPHFNGYINSMATGSTIKHISLKTMREYSFDCPDLPTQRRISSILSSLDAKIETNRKINEKLEAMAQALFKSWFIDFEPKIKLLPLSNIALLNKDSYSSQDNWDYFQYLDTGSVTNGKIDSYQKFIFGVDEIPSRAKRKVQNNDIIFSTVRPNQCHFALLSSIPDNTIVSTGFTTIRCNNTVCSNEIIYLSITQPSTITQLQQIAEQSVSAYPSLKPEDIGKCLIPTADEDTISCITNQLKLIHNQINSLQQESTRLANLRDTLLPKLMSGEIEV